MRHGYGISTIAIVAVVGVALVLAWMNYNSSAGINYEKRISDDKSSFKANLETVKEVAAPALKHAANDAALAVAESGGGMGTEKVWFCDQIKNPPTLHEVVYSLSNYTLTNFNTYLDDATEIYKVLGIETIPYTCSGCYPLLAPACPQTNYPISCDGWNATATGGSIYAIEDDITHTYVGDVKTGIDSDRFFWMYYRLLEAEVNDPVLKEFKIAFNTKFDCDPATNINNSCCLFQGDAEGVFNSIKKTAETKFESHFDSDVDCTVEDECTARRSIKVKITCTDKKYKIPGEAESGERYMTWIVKEMTTIGCEFNQCTIVGSGSSSSGAGGQPPANMAGYRRDKNYISDLSFAANYCNDADSVKCFDKDKCEEAFTGQLCFNP